MTQPVTSAQKIPSLSRENPWTERLAMSGTDKAAKRRVHEQALASLNFAYYPNPGGLVPYAKLPKLGVASESPFIRVTQLPEMTPIELVAWVVDTIAGGYKVKRWLTGIQNHSITAAGNFAKLGVEEASSLVELNNSVMWDVTGIWFCAAENRIDRLAQVADLEEYTRGIQEGGRSLDVLWLPKTPMGIESFGQLSSAEGTESQGGSQGPRYIALRREIEKKLQDDLEKLNNLISEKDRLIDELQFTIAINRSRSHVESAKNKKAELEAALSTFKATKEELLSRLRDLPGRLFEKLSQPNQADEDDNRVIDRYLTARREEKPRERRHYRLELEPELGPGQPLPAAPKTPAAKKSALNAATEPYRPPGGGAGSVPAQDDAAEGRIKRQIDVIQGVINDPKTPADKKSEYSERLRKLYLELEGSRRKT